MSSDSMNDLVSAKRSLTPSSPSKKKKSSRKLYQTQSCDDIEDMLRKPVEP